MPIPSPFNSLQIPRDLACEFFAVFSRLEFALKESGYVRVNRYGRATANWSNFAEEAILQVDKGSKLAHAIELLNLEPPQVQTNTNTWQATPLRGSTPIASAIDAAQRVRNNLFHGGKYTPHSPPGRDERLVQAALELLLAIIKQNNKIYASFA